MIKQILISATTSAVLSTSYAADFATADALWQQRDQGIPILEQSRQAYLDVIAQGELTPEEMIHATTQLGRLAIFEGSNFHNKDSQEGIDARRQLFGDCWKTYLPAINPVSNKKGSLGDRTFGKAKPFSISTPNFFYWKAACMALYAEVSGTAENVVNVGRLTWTIRRGSELDTTYQGGGILRVHSGIISNAKAKPLGMYDPQMALQLIDTALAADPYPGTNVAGGEFCENYERKSLTLIELERGAEARALLEEHITTIEEAIELEELPEGREPETLFCKTDLEGLVNTL